MDLTTVLHLTITWLLLSTCLITCRLLLLHLSSILAIQRTLLTHLTALLYIAIAVAVTSQCGGVLCRLLLGPLHLHLALLLHVTFYLGVFLTEVTLATLALTRLLLVLQPVRFCNLHHEAVYLRLLIANLSLALIPVIVDLFYNYDTKTKFMTFLTGAEVLEVNVTVAVEAALFLSLTCLLVLLCRFIENRVLGHQSATTSLVKGPLAALLALLGSSLLTHLLSTHLSHLYTHHLTISTPLTLLLLYSLLSNKEALKYIKHKFSSYIQ